MTTDQILVTAGGMAAILWVLWFFFSKRPRGGTDALRKTGKLAPTRHSSGN